MLDYLRRLLFILGENRKKLPLIFGLFLVSSLLDLLGVGLVPVAITAALKGGTPSGMNLLPQWDERTLVLVLAPALIVLYWGKSVLSYFIQRRVLRFGEEVRRDIIGRLMRIYLDAPYEFHLQRSSTTLMNLMSFSTTQAAGNVTGLLRLTCDLLMFLVIFGLLLWLDPIAILLFFVLVLVTAWAFQHYTATRVIKHGQAVNAANVGLMQNIQQAIFSFKETKILGVENSFIEQAGHYAEAIVRGGAVSGAMNVIPRLLIECLLLTFVVVILVTNYLRTGDVTSSLGLLGAFGAAGIRLFPAFTSSLSTINLVRYTSVAVQQLESDLRRISTHQPKGKEDEHAFAAFKSIQLRDVVYRYPGEKNTALQGINLTIERGQAIGLMGRSGAGKSTLADVFMGLLQPESGSVLVDDIDIRLNLRAWMDNIAYIPQMVNIADDSLRRNVAFGLMDADVDEQKVLESLCRAQLGDVVEQLRDGLDTVLGERGLRLSGGQRQRVALARALYHRRSIIVMDEATSALDAETESAVVESIQNLHGSVTLIIIAHRLSTLTPCDEIYNLSSGALLLENCRFQQPKVSLTNRH